MINIKIKVRFDKNINGGVYRVDSREYLFIDGGMHKDLETAKDELIQEFLDYFPEYCYDDVELIEE